MDAICEAKKVLAWLIVRDLDGQAAADAALDEWERVARGGLPEDIDEIKIAPDPLPLPRLLWELGLCRSTSEARRVIAQGGCKVDGKLETSVHAEVVPVSGMVVRVGKRKAARITL